MEEALILFQRVKSTLALTAALALWVPGLLGFYLVVAPAARLWPQKRLVLVTGFVRLLSRGVMAALSASGARFDRSGSLPTRRPILIVMNHQSLLDPVTVVLLAEPYVPAFITRRRYARFVPLISPCLRLANCPIVDPGRDSQASVATVEAAARELRHGLLLFPEGHRSVDGEVRSFKTKGLSAILCARQLPVYLVVTDGLWMAGRITDFVFNLHRIHSETEVLGPYQSPAAADEVPEFIARLRDILVARLRERRQGQHAGAGSATA